MACPSRMVARSAFMRSLLGCAERAAHIARTIRGESSLFSLLVEEKTGESKTKVSGADFKTLADVLIQCCVVAHIEHEYPSLVGRVFGEEESTFTNRNGETLTVQVDVCPAPGDDVALQASVEATAGLLCGVLDNNRAASLALATAVHQPLDWCQAEEEIRSSGMAGDMDLQHVAFWLDPIDNTGDYIHGVESSPNTASGLHCVTILLGAFDSQSGLPIAGAVSQPFHHRGNDDRVWHGRTLWGLCEGGTRYHSECLKECEPRLTPNSTNGASSQLVVIGSRNEDPGLVQALQHTATTTTSSSTATTTVTNGSSEGVVDGDGERVAFMTGSGAGFKALCVLTGRADAYVLSQSSTYQWDTCGVQAILQSLGGSMLMFTAALEASTEQRQRREQSNGSHGGAGNAGDGSPGDAGNAGDGSHGDAGNVGDWSSLHVRYNQSGLEGMTSPRKWCNSRGLLAVRDLAVAEQLLARCCQATTR